MANRANVSSPTSHILTDDAGKLSAIPALTPPVTGVDSGLQVHANLGSASIPVSQTTTGAAFFVAGQANVSTSVLLIAARATRRGAIVTNTDSTTSIYVGPSGVSTSNGEVIKAGNSLSIETTAAIYCVAGSGTVAVTFGELYD